MTSGVMETMKFAEKKDGWKAVEIRDETKCKKNTLVLMKRQKKIDVYLEFVYSINEFKRIYYETE